MKGSRDAYKLHYEANTRTFLYPPIKSCPMQLDLTLVLTALAVRRGLFPGGLDHILSTNEHWLKKDPVVDEQAVFVAVDKQGNLDPNEPMISEALNPRLQSACTDAGLPQHNTMYCFRRNRIVTAKHDHSTELAKTIAGHGEFTSTHTRYGPDQVRDIDIQAFTLARNSDEGLSREECRELSRQAYQSAYKVQSQDYEITLRRELKRRLAVNEKEDDEYIRCQKDLKGEIIFARNYIIRKLPAEESDTYPWGWTATFIAQYRKKLKSFLLDADA